MWCGYVSELDTAALLGLALFMHHYHHHHYHNHNWWYPTLAKLSIYSIGVFQRSTKSLVLSTQLCPLGQWNVLSLSFPSALLKLLLGVSPPPTLWSKYQEVAGHTEGGERGRSTIVQAEILGSWIRSIQFTLSIPWIRFLGQGLSCNQRTSFSKYENQVLVLNSWQKTTEASWGLIATDATLFIHWEIIYNGSTLNIT